MCITYLVYLFLALYLVSFPVVTKFPVDIKISCELSSRARGEKARLQLCHLWRWILNLLIDINSWFPHSSLENSYWFVLFINISIFKMLHSRRGSLFSTLPSSCASNHCSSLIICISLIFAACASCIHTFAFSISEHSPQQVIMTELTMTYDRASNIDAARDRKKAPY